MWMRRKGKRKRERKERNRSNGKREGNEGANDARIFHLSGAEPIGTTEYRSVIRDLLH
jgi:hypothetical protein